MLGSGSVPREVETSRSIELLLGSAMTMAIKSRTLKKRKTKVRVSRMCVT